MICPRCNACEIGHICYAAHSSAPARSSLKTPPPPTPADQQLIDALRHADRAKWCEEHQADVVYLPHGQWRVTFLDGLLNMHTHIETSRDAAIDRARGE